MTPNPSGAPPGASSTSFSSLTGGIGAGRHPFRLRTDALSARIASDIQIAVASVNDIRKARNSGTDVLDLAVIAPLNNDLVAEVSGCNIDATKGKKFTEAGVVDGA